MSLQTSEGSSAIVWEGNPWIVPNLVFRSVIVIAVLMVAMWLESFLGVAGQAFWGISITVWTVLSFFLIWIIGTSKLFWIKAKNSYILREGSLEIETGIVGTRSFVIPSSGFANMEVVQTLISKILNTGDIIIRTQDEPFGDKRMIMIHNPEDVANKIREVMSKPIFRMEK